MELGGDTYLYHIVYVYLLYTVIVSLEKREPNPFFQSNIIRLKNHHFLKDGRHSTQHSYFNGRGQPCWGFDDHYHHWSHLWTSKKHATNPALLSKLHYYNASVPSAAAMPSLPTQLWKNTLMG